MKKRTGAIPLAFLATVNAIVLMGCPQPNGSSGPTSSFGDLETSSSLTSAPATTGITNSQVGDPTTAVTSGSDTQGRKVRYTSTTTHYHASATYDTNVLLNPGTSVIYPGSVILGQTIDDGTYQEVLAGTKNAVSVATNLANVKDNNGNPGIVSGTIVPTYTTWGNLLNQILTQPLTKDSASGQFTYSMEEVTSKDELNLKVGANASYKGTFELSGEDNLDFSTSSTKHTYLVQLAQTFFTASVDLGASGGHIYSSFDSSIFKGYRPVYISTVAYGRLAYLTIVSTESKQTIDNQLKIAFKMGATVSADVNIGSNQSWFDSNTSTNITVIGSTGVSGLTLDGFVNMLTDSKQQFPANHGQIVKYTLRFVDDNSVANTVFNGDYTIVNTTVATGGFHVDLALTQFQNNTTDDVGIQSDFYGSLSVAHGQQNLGTPWSKSHGDYLMNRSGATRTDGFTSIPSFDIQDLNESDAYFTVTGNFYEYDGDTSLFNFNDIYTIPNNMFWFKNLKHDGTSDQCVLTIAAGKGNSIADIGDKGNVQVTFSVKVTPLDPQ